MAIATGPRIRMVYGNEVTHGSIPANLNVKQLRCITRDINADIKGLGSKEVYPDRQRRDFRHGFQSSVGQFQYELSIAQQAAGVLTGVGMDDMLANIFASTFSAVGAIPSTPGTLKVGTTLSTFAFERQFLDITQYEAHAGCVVNQLTIDFKPESIIGGTLDILGMAPQTAAGTSIQGSGTLTAATTAPPCDVFLGAITEGGSPIAVATAVSLTIKGGRQLSPVIGAKFSPDVFEGSFLVSGTLSAMFQDVTLLNKFINETVSTMVITAAELGGTPTTGRRMVFTLPVIKYATNQKKPKAEGPVIQDCQFECLYDSVSGTTMQIDRYL